MEDLLFYLGALLAFGMGMGCGSYATMPYYRLNHGIKSSGKWEGGKKSFCPHCKVQLRTRDLVPVFNRLWHRGKCFNCGTEIPIVYWLIEFFASVAAVVLYIRYGFSEQLLISYGVMMCLIVLWASDTSFRKLPNAVHVTALFFIALNLTADRLFDQIHIFGFACLILIGIAKHFENKTGTEYACYDHLKLIAIAALWMGWFGWILFALLSLIAILILRATVATAERPGPYGAAIASIWALQLCWPELFTLDFFTQLLP